MGCIESKNMRVLTKRLDKLEAHMNLLDDDMYYIEKRLKRREKKLKSGRPILVEDESMTDNSYDSNATTPPDTLESVSPKTNSGMHATR